MNEHSEVKAIRPGDEVDLESLNDYFLQNKIDFPKVLNISQFQGGYSNLTYLLTTQRGQFVLRKPPNGVQIQGAHDMLREYKILSALQGKIAVPQTILACADSHIIGTNFYIMSKVEGNIIRPSTVKSMQLQASDWQRLSTYLIDELVKLHAFDYQSSTLSGLGKADGYVDRQVNGWIKRYEASLVYQNADAQALVAWLQHFRPTAQSPVLIHNDFKYDNVVFNHDLTQLNAILDWEMTTIGDPLMDLGASLAYWVEAHEGPFMKKLNTTWLAGNLTRSQIVEHYGIKTNRNLKDILFYYIFGLFKNTVILQQIYARWKNGLTQDERFSQLNIGMDELCLQGVKTLEKNKI